MSNPFVSLWHFLERLFGKAATEVEWLLKQVNAYTPKVMEVVATLAAIASANPNDVTNKIVEYLKEFGVAEEKVSAWVNAHLNSNGGEALHDAAALIIANIFPVGTAANILNFAIELAYGAFKRKSAENAPKPA